MKTLQGALVDHFRHVAGLRERNAEDWPQDRTGCLRTAAALDSLADYTEQLPANDDVFIILSCLYGEAVSALQTGLRDHQSPDGDPGHAPAHIVGRYARRLPSPPCPEQHREMLTRLCQVLAGES